MKWLFLLLLIINLGIFAWGYQHEQMRQSVSIVAGSDVGDMRLLDEAQQASESKILAPTPTPTTELEPEPEVVTMETESEVGVAPTAAVAEPSEKAETPTEIAAETESAPQQQIETETESEAETELQAGTGQVVDTVIATVKQTASLANETEKQPELQTDTGRVVETDPKTQSATADAETEQPALENPAADTTPAPAIPEITSRCGSIGPLKDRKTAKEIVQGLKKSKFKAELEKSVEKKQIGFWVVIPPLVDGSRAREKIAELSRAGLKDIWHFRGGGLKNAISLGMFSKKENAENYSREVLKKGFKTKIQPRYLNKTRYLVKFSINKPKIVTRLMWRMVEWKYSKHEFHEQPCEPIATR